LAKVLHEAGEHLADLDQFVLAKSEFARRNNRGGNREFEMVLDFCFGNEAVVRQPSADSGQVTAFRGYCRTWEK
jgi:hypothetical protein